MVPHDGEWAGLTLGIDLELKEVKVTRLSVLVKFLDRQIISKIKRSTTKPYDFRPGRTINSALVTQFFLKQNQSIIVA